MLLKKLNGEDLIKIIEGFISVLININFLSHSLLYLFIDIYYDKSKPFQLFIMLNLHHSIYYSIYVVISITVCKSDP